MAEVRWEALSSGQFEDMICCLLSHMNPDIKRLDGAGGDGGRDAEFSRDARVEIYQLKGFTGRLNGGRRGQIKSSLKRAAKRTPSAWNLVVPIDPTPGEAEWFDNLRSDYPFPLDWKGRTWLNAQLAERPFIPAYFLGDEKDRVFELLGELREEQAAVTDLQSGMDRMRALAGRINELDPYYRFDVAVRGGTVEVGFHPRYEGAELDRPITGNLSLSFPNTPEGLSVADRFREAMDFGTSVDIEEEFIQSFEIDGPAGIGGSFAQGASLRIGPPQPEEPYELPIVLGALSPGDAPLASLPITLTERTVGRRGAIVRGSDRPDVFGIEMRMDPDERKVTMYFRFSSTGAHFPNDLLPAISFMRAAAPPNRIRVLVGDQKVPLGDPIEVPEVIPLEPEWVQVVEDLARLQRETNTYFTMPAEFTKGDIRELREALALLDGEEVIVSWKRASFELGVDDPERFLANLMPLADGGAWLQQGQGEATIAGHTLPLGMMRTHFPSARLVNADQVRAIVESAKQGEEIMVQIILEALNEEPGRTSLLKDAS